MFVEDTPGTADGTQEPGTAEPSQLKTLADLLSEEPEGSTSPDDDGDEGKPAGNGKLKGKPKKFNDLAGALGIELDDLYKLELASAKDGSPITIEQLKALHAKQDDFTVRELEFEETRQKREGDLLRAQNELRELVSSLPKNAIKPEVLEAVRQKHDATLQRERAATLEAIPSWADDTKRTEDITGIVKHLEGYGFPKSFVLNISDHRMLRYFRENWQRETRLRMALESIKPAGPGKTNSSKSTGKPASKPSTASSKSKSRNPLLDFLA
ncbi:MAG: hypothetical protein WD795_16400 [Woeseia sp.]